MATRARRASVRTRTLRAIWAGGLAVVVWPTVVAASANSRALYAKGLVPFHAERWEEAHRLFDAAVRADPQDALATYYRALSAARLGRIKEATTDVERAVQLRP